MRGTKHLTARHCTASWIIVDCNRTPRVEPKNPLHVRCTARPHRPRGVGLVVPWAEMVADLEVMARVAVTEVAMEELMVVGMVAEVVAAMEAEREVAVTEQTVT